MNDPQSKETNMKAQIIAVSVLLGALALPVAAMAADSCGTPQGMGTTNPFVPNSSNCEPVQSYAGPMSPNNYTDSTRPAGYGTTNPYPFNAGTTGPKVYSDNVSVGDWSAKKPAGYGTKNPYIFNSGRLRPGEAPL
jgi:hypothetical protein